MLLHPLSEFEIQRYYQKELRFKMVFTQEIIYLK